MTPRQPVHPDRRRGTRCQCPIDEEDRWSISSLGCAVVNVAAPTPPRRCTSATTASGRSRSPTTTSAIAATVSRERIAAGPRSIWRYADLLPVGRRRARSTSAPASPRWCGPTAWPPSSGLGELWIKDDTANPTGSFKDRVVSVALTKARQLGFKVAACASTGNLANSVAAHAARAGMDSVVLIPHDLEAAKVTMTAVYGGHGDRRRGHLRRRQPAVRRADQRAARAGPSSTSTCAPTTPRAPRPWPSRSPSSWAGRRPDHVVVPDRLGQPADQGGQGLRRAGQGRPARRGARRAGLGGPGRGLLAGGHRLRRGHRRHPAGQARRRSPSRWPSATRPTAGTPSTRSAASGGSCAAVTDDEIVEGIRLLARTEGIFAETAGGVTIATLAKLAASGVVRPDERVVALVTGHGLKTVEALAAVRSARPPPSPPPWTPSTPRSTADATSHRHRGDRPMSVTVRIPTQLRTLTGGAGEVDGRGRHAWARPSRPSTPPTPGFAERLFDDGGQPAPLRQRLPGRRGRPLPRRPGHAGRRRPDALDRPGRRRGLTARVRPEPAGVAAPPSASSLLHERPEVVTC